jgi:transposase
VAHPTTEMIVAEIGTAMRRLPSAEHLAAWAGVAPGNHASGGTRMSGKTRPGKRVLRPVLVQAAHAAARTKHTDVSAQSWRLATQRGKKRMMMTVAPSMS